jgi:two-component system, NarL family, sensor kinase
VVGFYFTKYNSEQLLRRNRELTILNSIAQAFNSSVDLEQAMIAALAQVAELFDLKTGWVWLIDETNSTPYLASAQNLPPGLLENPHLMEGSCYCLDTYQAGDLNGAANVNVIACSRLKKLVGGTADLRYHASIPLYAHGKQLGVFNVASPGWSELSPDDLRILHTVGDLLGIAIERAYLYTHSIEFGASEERSRLAREIHDTLVQGLTGISLKLETADYLMESGSDIQQIRSTLQQALDLARANLDEARRSVQDLRAVPLEGRGLAEALSELCKSASQRDGLQVAFEVKGAARPVPGRMETGLYRIAQEALLNVRRHSNARHAVVRLILQPQQVSLVIEDDGQGFDPSQISSGHFGITGLMERARLMGGALDLKTGLGEGTVVDVVVPIPA